MNHLTDETLNEYLDNELADRAQVEEHLSVCADCAARLAALQTLFTELNSLPELELSRPIAARIALPSNLPAALPRSLRLTVTLQAALAGIAIIVAVPFIANFLSAIQLPSLTDILLPLQTQWSAWLDRLSSFHFPSIPQIPVPELSSLILTLTLTAVSMLWLVGNGLLLRNQIK